MVKCVTLYVTFMCLILLSVFHYSFFSYFPFVREMCTDNRSSLEVSYTDLGDMVPTLAIWLADAPREIFKLFNEALMEVVLDHFPEYRNITKEVKTRIAKLPIVGVYCYAIVMYSICKYFLAITFYFYLFFFCQLLTYNY